MGEPQGSGEPGRAAPGLAGRREPQRFQGHCHPTGTAAVVGRHKGADGKERALSMAHVIPGTPSRGRDLVLGFIAGALAVVTFHQVMVFMLSSVGLIQSRVYAMRGVP